MSGLSPPDSADALLDLRKMQETLGSEDMVETTLKSFLMRAPKTTTNMRNAYDAKDFAKLRRDAHSLKGACGYVASDHLRDSALNLQLAAEAATRGEEVDPPVEACMQEVLHRLDLLCVTIDKVIADGSGPTARAPSITSSPQPAHPVARRDDHAVSSGASQDRSTPSSSSAAVEQSSTPLTRLVDLRKMRDCRESPAVHRLAAASARALMPCDVLAAFCLDRVHVPSLSDALLYS